MMRGRVRKKDGAARPLAPWVIYAITSSFVGALWYPALLIPAHTRKILLGSGLTSAFGMGVAETIAFLAIAGLVVGFLFRDYVRSPKNVAGYFIEGFALPFAGAFFFVCLCLLVSALREKLALGDGVGAIVGGLYFTAAAVWVTLPMGLFSGWMLRRSWPQSFLESEDDSSGPAYPQ